MAHIGSGTIVTIGADDLSGGSDLLGILFQQLLDQRITLQHGVGAVVEVLCCVDGMIAVGEVDLHLGMGDAGVVAAALNVINALWIAENISLVGVTFKHEVHIAFGQTDVVVGTQVGGGNGAVFALTKTVVNHVNDQIGTLCAQFVRFLLNKICQFGSGFEINAFGLVGRNGRVAIAHGPNDSDLRAAAFYHHRTLAVRHLLIGFAVVNVDGQEGEFCHFRVFADGIFAPVELVVAEGHGGKIQFIHPVGDQIALG